MQAGEIELTGSGACVVTVFAGVQPGSPGMVVHVCQLEHVNIGSEKDSDALGTNHHDNGTFLGCAKY